MEFGWNSVGIRLEFGWNSVEIRLEFSWNLVGIRLEFGCNSSPRGRVGGQKRLENPKIALYSKPLIWQVPYMASALYGKCLVWQVPCMASALYGKCLIWQVPYVASALCGKCLIWQVPYTASALYGKRLIVHHNAIMMAFAVSGNRECDSLREIMNAAPAGNRECGSCGKSQMQLLWEIADETPLGNGGLKILRSPKP